MENNEIWYAVMRDHEDTDHGTGSFDRAEAIRMARKMREDGDGEAYVAAIDTDDDFCQEEIHDLLLKEVRWTEGWHENGCLEYLVEDGLLKRGVINGRTVYPYVWSDKLRCYNNVVLKANKRNFDRLEWK